MSALVDADASPEVPFADRRAAGHALAERVRRFAPERAIVIALARGGVPVAAEVSRALDAPLDVLAVRKLGAPGHREYAVGAIAEGRVALLDDRAAAMTGMTQELLDRTVDREARELLRQAAAYRAGRPPIPVRGRATLVVDDGIATGLTVLAAVRAVRHRGAARVLVAAPVASRDAVAWLADEADEVVTVYVPRSFGSVSQWYRNFAPVTDEEVVTALSS